MENKPRDLHLAKEKDIAPTQIANFIEFTEITRSGCRVITNGLYDLNYEPKEHLVSSSGTKF